MSDILLSKSFLTFCLAAHFVFCSVRFSKKLRRTQTKFQSIGQPKQWNQSLVPPNKWCGISFLFMKMHPKISVRKLLVPELSFRILSHGTQMKKGRPETDPYYSVYQIIFNFPGNKIGRSPNWVTCHYFHWRLHWYDKHLWSEYVSRRGSRILKWGVNFCNNVTESKPGWGVWGLCISMIDFRWIINIFEF